jgi:hypothetical protein
MRPTLEEFLDSVKDISRPYDCCSHVVEHYFDNSPVFRDKVRSMTWAKQRDFRNATIQALDISREFLWMSHETGGYSGGSCWDDSDPQPYHNSDPMPQFTAFYQILERVVPNLTFLQAKVMEPIVIKETSDSESEYYGNSTDYAIKYVNLTDLYNYLVEKELI